jgi:hypothetical protein
MLEDPTLIHWPESESNPWRRLLHTGATEFDLLMVQLENLGDLSDGFVSLRERVA